MNKAILFDLDGVLVDATEWHFEALNKALLLFGFKITRSEHLSVYNGLPTAEKLKMMSSKSSLPIGLHEIIKSMKKKYTDEQVTLNCFPDYEKQIMLKQLKNKGYALACCSNAQKYSVVNMLNRAHLTPFFDLIVGNDEGHKPKPAPDIYLHAFQALGVKPNECYIVEDAPHGVKAATDSGAHVLAVKGYQDVNLSLFSQAELI